MGFRCPVCDAPQADGEHLANHLAFTAMTREDEHAAWLDEHAPDWGDDSPEELAGRVVDHAPETDVEPIDEPENRPEPPAGTRSTGTETRFDGVVDAAVEDVLDEAREMTEEMFESEDGGSADGDRPSETQEE